MDAKTFETSRLGRRSLLSGAAAVAGSAALPRLAAASASGE
jgi:hypothetical protein